MTDTIIKADEADSVYREILEVCQKMMHGSLELGRLFKRVRDEKLYQRLDDDTFETFCGRSEITFGYSTACLAIQIYEKFILELSIPLPLLLEAGPRKLREILPVVDQDPEQWVHEAKVLSCSDLKIKVNEVRGVNNLPQRKGTTFSPFTPLPQTYLTYVKTQKCILCEKTPIDPAHFPKSKKAGAEDHWIIPLCRECHSEQHSQGTQWFLWTYKDKIFRYFYDLITKLFSEINNV